MSGFQVVAGDIRSAAQQIDAAASEVHACDPSGALGEVGGAMTGSQSTSAAAALRSAWSKRFRGWSSDAEGQGTRLRDSAAAYDASDYQADMKMHVLLRRTGEL